MFTVKEFTWDSLVCRVDMMMGLGFGGSSPPPPPPAANHQRLMPGSLFPVYMNETGTIQAQVPGAGYINEKSTT